MRLPFNGKFPVTQPFGANPDVYGAGGHKGIDYGLPSRTPVYAVHDGVVNKPAFQPNGFGTYLTLSWDAYIVYYGHLDSVVKTGIVKEGELIGYSDNSGWSSGPHLHIEVYFARALINPEQLFNKEEPVQEIQKIYESLDATNKNLDKLYKIVDETNKNVNNLYNIVDKKTTDISKQISDLYVKLNDTNKRVDRLEKE